MNDAPQLSSNDVQTLIEWRRLRRIESSLAEWARLNGFEPAPHHALLIDKLEQVVAGKIKRLLFILPPGSAKSTYASVLFPPWFLAQHENRAILACSHSAEKAEEFGRRARNAIEAHEREIGFALASHSKAAGRWETTKGGLFFCTGVGSGIAGYRADLGLIDDPIGKKEDADSKLIRDKHWDWYQFDFKPRLKPNASVVLIQTRWHEDDLAGRILENEGADWDVVHIPLIAEDGDPLGRPVGESLWPSYFTPKFIEDAKASPAFTALYQGRPTPEEGDYFKADWFRGYTLPELPNELRVYVASDHAVSTAQEADRTCLVAGGIDANDDLWILPDIWWKKAGAEESVEAMLDMARRRKPIVWWAERGHITKSIGPFLKKRMSEEHVYCYIDEVVPSRDKPARARSIQGRMSMGKVHFPTFASWWPEARHELLCFPAGKHDDFVDALAHLGLGLESMTRVFGPVERKLGPKPMTLGWLKDRCRKEEWEKELAASGF